MPIDQVKLPVSDLDASRAFYSAALAPFGYVLVYNGESSLGFGRGDGGGVDEPFAVERILVPSVPTHLAFTRRQRTARPLRKTGIRSPGFRLHEDPWGAPVRRLVLRGFRPRSGRGTTSKPCTTVRRRGASPPAD